jgi:excisionase family DNA binding protein
MERYLRVGDVAKHLGVNPRTIRRWLSWRQVKFYTTPGGERRIPTSEVERILGHPLDQPHNAPEAR